MSIKTTLITTTALAAFGASVAFADITAQQLADAYSDYDFVEIKTGPTQIKVEATRGDQTLEVVYDIATGEIVKSEVTSADADDRGRTGVEFDTEDEDFSDESDDEEDDEEDDEDDDEDDEGDDEDDEDDEDEDDDEDDDEEDDEEDDED